EILLIDFAMIIGGHKNTHIGSAGILRPKDFAYLANVVCTRLFYQLQTLQSFSERFGSANHFFWFWMNLYRLTRLASEFSPSAFSRNRHVFPHPCQGKFREIIGCFYPNIFQMSRMLPADSPNVANFCPL